MHANIIAGIVLVGGLLVAGIILLSSGSGGSGQVTRSPGGATAGTGASTATVEGDVQYVDILARGGYSPRVTKAQAGMKTIIRMRTENTYDCSIALVIPDLGYQSYLTQTGVEEIEVPAEKAQGTLRGMCSMAMYHFQIDFE